ncbi:lim-4 [Pristionchus pacificus]|uniref:Lim-4 n=1 Tax=Pristionchus pacificus TaxID=54126 RepID=A0A2A6C8K1_PRIPA|nr:lim-4 [Pristionchus pacificus]|eukprot:PDM74535.1 lim-4 [Pristionchus pacificus]
MEIDDPTPSSSSHHTLDDDVKAAHSTLGDDYVSLFSYGSVPPPYIKDPEDELLLQPTLDYDSLQVLPEPYKPSSPACTCCGCGIEDRHYFAVGGKNFHENCLRCCACSTSLAELKCCFERSNSIYCKGCYDQTFSAKCAGCDRSISPSDWVRRARIKVYHIACFGCNQCKRQLSTGEEFAIQENKLLCKQHYDELVEGDSAISKQKTKRVRTTFTDEQINVLQTHFNIDSNPDGADLERIALQTGLSKRVTQVWFQKPGTGGGGRTDSLPSSSEDALSPHSEMSNDECIFQHTSVNNMEDASAHHHRMDMMGMGLQAIDYD